MYWKLENIVQCSISYNNVTDKKEKVIVIIFIYYNN